MQQRYMLSKKQRLAICDRKPASPWLPFLKSMAGAHDCVIWTGFPDGSELCAFAVHFSSESMGLIADELLLVWDGCRDDTEEWECLERLQLIEAIIVLKSGIRPEHQDVQLVASQAK